MATRSVSRTERGDVHYALCNGTKCPCYMEGRAVELVKRQHGLRAIRDALFGRSF